jgi:NAD(P)H-nitrite reductase large subunit
MTGKRIIIIGGVAGGASAAPLKPPIPGIERPGHFMVRGIPDVKTMVAWIEDRQARCAVVVGGGYIGLEMAEQLQRRWLTVALAEALPQVMAPLDLEMAGWLHEELRAHGVALYLGDGVVAFESPQADEEAAVSVVVLKSGMSLPADLVILALGVRPEIDLAHSAGLEIGALGGIRVNEHLQTSDSHIWALGDAIEVRDAVTGAWSLIKRRETGFGLTAVAGSAKQADLMDPGPSLHRELPSVRRSVSGFLVANGRCS